MNDGPELSGQETETPAETRPGPSAGRAAGRGSRLARRRRVLLGVAVGAALLAVGGLIGAAFVKSPAQLAADTAPPAKTPTTAKVTSQDLTSSVAMRGVVYPSTQYDVSASGTAAQLYISKLDVKAGGTVRNGELLAEIDGAPMFVLTGSVPAWRDLAPGESGPDVAELQKALAALGYSDEGDTPGYYGAGTEDAVSAFYEHLGYTVPTAAPAGGTGTGAGAATGPQVPQGDVLFLPSLPATVIAVNGAAGQQAGSPFLELSAGGGADADRRAAAVLCLADQDRADGEGLRRGDRDQGGRHRGGAGHGDPDASDRHDGGHRRLRLGRRFAGQLGVFGHIGRFRFVGQLGIFGYIGRFRRDGQRFRFVVVRPGDRRPVLAAARGAERRECPGHRGDGADRGAGAHCAGRRDRHHGIRTELRHGRGRGREADEGAGHPGLV
jgi:hypothetical protein